MQLKVKLISGGRYYKAGEDIPEDALPDFASRYASEVEDGEAVEASYAETLQQQRADLDGTAKPKVVKASGREGKMKGKSYVKREGSVRLGFECRNSDARRNALLASASLLWR